MDRFWKAVHQIQRGCLYGVTFTPGDPQRVGGVRRHPLPPSLYMRPTIYRRRQILDAQELDVSQMSVTSGFNEIDDVINDPAGSFWLKGCLASALTRDPIDVINDLSVLARLLKEWCKEQNAVAERMFNHIAFEDEIP